MTAANLDAFTLEYIEVALFSTSDIDESGEDTPLDANYRAEDIHADTLDLMVKDCEDFRSQFGALFGDESDRAARDFWLTRNRHGAGFWDGDWSKPHVEERIGMQPRYKTVGDYLTAMSHPYGEFNLYAGDDGMIHGQ